MSRKKSESKKCENKKKSELNEKQKLGKLGEDLATQYLENKGYEIAERNFSCQQGEIDIIARDGKYLVFAEVKYRSDTGKGLPQEAVDYRKQRKISRVADYYLMCKHMMGLPCRFDVIAILGEDIQWLKDAFPYIEPY